MDKLSLAEPAKLAWAALLELHTAARLAQLAVIPTEQLQVQVYPHLVDSNRAVEPARVQIQGSSQVPDWDHLDSDHQTADSPILLNQPTTHQLPQQGPAQRWSREQIRLQKVIQPLKQQRKQVTTRLKSRRIQLKAVQ